jgi:transglutaminase-like putative cysteine protease
MEPVQQRISVFTHIRDIPYAIIPGWRNSDTIIRMMISENRGWCGPKHHLLVWMFRRMGIETRLVFIPFRWQDQQVRYPPGFHEILPYLPEAMHLCCKASLNGSWQLIDATWDPPLKDAGFPINERWDGFSETVPAVTEIEPGLKKPEHPLLPEKRKERIDFVNHLNQWMEEIRVQKRNKPPGAF